MTTPSHQPSDKTELQRAIDKIATEYRISPINKEPLTFYEKIELLTNLSAAKQTEELINLSKRLQEQRDEAVMELQRLSREDKSDIIANRDLLSKRLEDVEKERDDAIKYQIIATKDALSISKERDQLLADAKVRNEALSLFVAWSRRWPSTKHFSEQQHAFCERELKECERIAEHALSIPTAQAILKEKEQDK